jgi:hypothetical protein
MHTKEVLASYAQILSLVSAPDSVLQENGLPKHDSQDFLDTKEHVDMQLAYHNACTLWNRALHAGRYDIACEYSRTAPGKKVQNWTGFIPELASLKYKEVFIQSSIMDPSNGDPVEAHLLYTHGFPEPSHNIVFQLCSVNMYPLKYNGTFIFIITGHGKGMHVSITGAYLEPRSASSLEVTRGQCTVSPIRRTVSLEFPRAYRCLESCQNEG